MDKYKIEKTYCNCHPETCNCKSYKIYFNNLFICSGNNLKEMQLLINLANSRLTQVSKE